MLCSAILLACSGCASVSYVKLTRDDVVGTWEFPDGSWVILEPDGKAYVDPILYAGDKGVPLPSGQAVGGGGLAATWALVGDGQGNYVQYDIPTSSIPKALITEVPVSPLAGADLYGCMENGHVDLFGQVDPDSVCDSGGMMRRVDESS